MKPRQPIVLISGLLLLCTIILGFGATQRHHQLATRQRVASQQWQPIETQMKNQITTNQDLIPLVKPIMKHEGALLLALSADDQAFSNATSISEKIAIHQVLNQHTSQLLRAMQRRYPELAGVQADWQQRYQMSQTRIRTQRTTYNQAADHFNHQMAQFPGHYLSDSLGFQPMMTL